MRIAVLVIGLVFAPLIAVPSCTISFTGEISGNEALSEVGAAGVGIGFLFVLGAAFVIGIPKASTAIFILATFTGFGLLNNAEAREFAWFWGFSSLALAIMSYFGIREKKKKPEATSSPSN